MDENGVHEPLLQRDENIESDRDRDSKADDFVPENYDADVAPLPLVSENSGKWKYKHHCALSGDEFRELHNHSEGTLPYYQH